MSRRLIAGLVATLLAAVAAVLVIAYVARADQRAMAEMSPVSVLVVTQPVPEGTPAEALTDHLAVEEVPATAVVPGGVTSLEQVENQLTTTALQPGEQLLASRFAPPEEEDADGEVAVPEGYHQVTVQLPVARVLGGHIAAGDTVGLFVSSDGETHLRLHKVLVTRVQGGVAVVQNEDGSETTQAAADSLMVTVAVPTTDAEIVVNAAEFSGIWLSLEPKDAPEDGTRVVNREDLLP
ncbi:Flp pilus assembly protein CpaB [Georgenia sp. H159]|uniref:Flp pilus assembly protein CpaB n=1 Tax=Georgenia sp. H159 TaxID=3076115 RepID=UPI002D77D9CF|nr:RcpC/CpaB family pilus assembly protein [Georgenia sp. H159]